MSLAYVRWSVLPVLLFALACGGGGGDDDGDDDDDIDGGDGTDELDCGFGANERYLPFEPGFSWEYKVTDLDTGATETKAQTLTDAGGGQIEQTTGKLDGSTVSLLEVDGDRVMRLEQEDLDAADVSERVTVYDPGQIRIDESPDRLVEGAMFEESYVETETPAGGASMTPVSVTDVWEVVAVDAICDVPAGSFTCIRLRRSRDNGTVAVKEFFFAKGIGKVKETGDSQLEELVRCSSGS